MSRSMETNETLVQGLVAEGSLRTERIVNAFRRVDRAGFVRPEDKRFAYLDQPLPIGAGQTISQPHTVAIMLELLAPLPGEHVLDVGSGSGWTTALLSDIVGPEGGVVGVEREPSLVEFGRANLETYDEGDARIIPADGVLGYPAGAPYHRILVSAAANELPQELVGQLRTGGVMVIPVQDAVWRVEKRSEDDILIEKHSGFRFVPLRAGR